MSPKTVRSIGWLGLGLIAFLNLLVLIFVLTEIYASFRPGPLVIHDAKGMQEAFDAYKERVDNTQKLITALIGLSSLYALALGFTTFLSAQQYLQKIKDDTESSDRKATAAVGRIDKLREDAAAQISTLNDEIRARIEDAERRTSEQVRLMESSTRRQLRQARVEAARERRELQKQFPLFGSIDRMFRDLLDKLGFLSQPFMADFETIGDDQWRNAREGIKFYERAFAGFDLLDAPAYRRQIIDVFSYLGRFYRKNLEKTKQPYDLDRARFYSEMAVQKSGRRYTTLNNLAGAWMDGGTPEDLGKARDLATESLNKHPRQQRALYILAWIDDEESNFSEAVRRLKLAVPIPVWEDQPHRMRWAIHYNLACALSKLAAETEAGRDKNLDEAIENLKLAVPAETQIRAQFEEDLHGDLTFLDSNRPDAIQAIRNVQVTGS